MTDVIKNKIAVNCNQKEIQQMVIGSDVETIVDDKNSTITIQNLTNSAETEDNGWVSILAMKLQTAFEISCCLVAVN